jgi:L-ascorbate metabolism protein UlaG (beta-lactamase superfamily)
MKRRQLIRYFQSSAIATAGTVLASGVQSYQAQSKKAAQSGPLTLQWLGHTSFLFSGSGQRILTNPFKTIGCTAKYRSPKVAANFVMISSQLLDEGFVEILPGDPKLLFNPGIYRLNGLEIQGIRTDHDRQGGRRFGANIAWLWTQGGIRILHLGGIAGALAAEQKILIGRPDLVLIPVGGGAKAYNPEEAKQAIQDLNPRAVIPTHYRTAAADPQACDLVGVDDFLKLMSDSQIRKVGSDTLTLNRNALSDKGPVIYTLNYGF